MAEYITEAQMLQRLGKPNFTPDDAAEASLMREAISRAIDDYMEVEDDFFTPPTTPETRRVYGEGTSTIFLPAPISGITTITSEAGVIIPNFTAIGNRLQALSDAGDISPLYVWRKGQYYDITSLWGYAVIPPQIKEAALEIVSRIYRERPESGFAGMVGEASRYEGVLVRGFPSIARIILDGFKKKVARNKEGGNLVIA